LSFLDRYLPLWILGAMAAGVGLGRAFVDLPAWLERFSVTGISIPIGVGLLWMMYPVLAKVQFEKLGQLKVNPRMLSASLVLNWIVGPVLMFGLAWLCLPDLPHYRDGLILVGLARCIAMVLIWNNLACGSGEVATVLVALNSVFQIVCYSGLGWLFLTAIPTWMGAATTDFHVSAWLIARSVLVFLGVPLLAGVVTRLGLIKAKGKPWYETHFLPRVGPTALFGLLYTVVLLFALQGERLVHLPWDVVRIAIPLMLYFALMFGVSFVLGHTLRFSYEDTTALAFTAAGNNFELAIAVAIGVFGLHSAEALAGVVGPLIEVPALLGLVYVALAAKRYFPTSKEGAA
jgi:ACR3 family arsenite transporter